MVRYRWLIDRSGHGTDESRSGENRYSSRRPPVLGQQR
jgi:hypothetical protein